MTAQAVPDQTGSFATEPANDRVKRSSTYWFWSSITIATVLHFAVFAFWPEMTAEDVSFSMEDLEAIELPPEIEIPPPPEAISRPATPVIAEANIEESRRGIRDRHHPPPARQIAVGFDPDDNR